MDYLILTYLLSGTYSVVKVSLDATENSEMPEHTPSATEIYNLAIAHLPAGATFVSAMKREPKGRWINASGEQTMPLG